MIERIRKPEKSFEKIITTIRSRFIAELEDLYTRPDFNANENELATIERLKNGEKIKPSRIVIDKIARIATENGIYTLEDLHKIYDVFFYDWQEVAAIRG